ncbi:hypothetical protein [Companilactobacillus alimentarius]|uniref:Deacetylase sirtuin-type domain-containing protein n=1 Tax=Companilactobacillus alimentarius DSM 20249 TaxID=1423720 RepID=A0A2K9HKH2_9LACO|nr:hypothetical protein [Companilactobacillus alimentarius]AUI72297.1 hypothetical protein LA20249_08925 [Companilactobacillus alimentarius DSM 20249]KRK75994.1 hypothetical protein FC67_GL000763 [Companilactobacillus alimentarius DSM 20249]GEO45686.1 hypothetical protein LAL01_19180 [Companilactobacillus alimentarius]
MNPEIKKAKELLSNSDAILITASNGLSIAEGYNIFADDKNFRAYFNEFKALYGISNLVQGVYAELPQTEHDIFMKKIHQYLIDDYQPSDVFQDVKKLVADKDYFIVTSNADTHFQLNEFNPKNIWEVEGNLDGMNMKSEAWIQQQQRCQDFTKSNKDKKLVQLELGIGSHNQMIKEPMMQLVASHPNWSYITLNLPNEIKVIPEIENQSIQLAGDIKETLNNLLKED